MKRLISQTVFSIFSIFTVAAGANSVQAGLDPILESKILAEKVGGLRGLVEGYSYSPIASQIVCDLESEVAQLCQRLTCPHEVAELRCAMRDVTESSRRVSLVVDRICALRDNPQIRRELNCVLTQVARTRAGVEELIALQSRIQPVPSPVPPIPNQSTYLGSPNFPASPVPAPELNYRTSQFGTPAWARNGFAAAPQSSFSRQRELEQIQIERLRAEQMRTEQIRAEQLRAEISRTRYAPPATPFDAARRSAGIPRSIQTERPGLALMGLILSELNR